MSGVVCLEMEIWSNVDINALNVIFQDPTSHPIYFDLFCLFFF